MSSSYFLPEWAPVKAILIAWPFPDSAWQATYAEAVECYWGMLSAFAVDQQVWVLLHPQLDLAAFERELSARGIKPSNVRLDNSILYDDTWIRDYGPLSLSDGYVEFLFNGWGGKYVATNDNKVPSELSQLLLPKGLTSYDFVCEGGALETNGAGVLLANKECVVDELRNPLMPAQAVEENLKRYLGVEQIVWIENIRLTGDDTDGHIDTIVRFVNEKTLVYSGRNDSHIDADQLLRLHYQVTKLAENRQWTAIELPTPCITSQLDGRTLPATYANFLICNEKVFVPIYQQPEDELALSVLSKAFPNRTIVPVVCTALLEQHGSLHCATMQIADLH